MQTISSLASIVRTTPRGDTSRRKTKEKRCFSYSLDHPSVKSSSPSLVEAKFFLELCALFQCHEVTPDMFRLARRSLISMCRVAWSCVYATPMRRHVALKVVPNEKYDCGHLLDDISTPLLEQPQTRVSLWWGKKAPLNGGLSTRKCLTTTRRRDICHRDCSK